MKNLTLLCVLIMLSFSLAEEDYFEKNCEYCFGGGFVAHNSNQKSPKGKEDVQACYYRKILKDGEVTLVSYASIFPMPMIGKPRYDKSKMGCFFVESKPYVTFGTNLPNQAFGDYVQYTEKMARSCYVDSVLAQKGSTLFYLRGMYSCDIAVSSPEGCHEQKNGIRMVYPKDFRCGRYEVSEFNEKGLKHFARMMDKKNLGDFMDETGNFEGHKPDMWAVLPYKFENSDARALGDSAAAHAPGMYYYFGATQVDSVSFKKSPFKNLKDALDHCYDWGKKQLR